MLKKLTQVQVLTCLVPDRELEEKLQDALWKINFAGEFVNNYTGNLPFRSSSPTLNFKVNLKRRISFFLLTQISFSG